MRRGNAAVVHRALTDVPRVDVTADDHNLFRFFTPGISTTFRETPSGSMCASIFNRTEIFSHARPYG